MRFLMWTLVVAVLWLGNGCNTGEDSGSGKAPATGQPADNTGSAVPNAVNEGEVIEQLAVEGTELTYMGELPPDWPFDLRLYPDATLGETKMVDQPQGKTFSAKLMTAASPIQVVEFYEQQAADLGGATIESTISPIRCFGQYFCPNYALNLTAELGDDGTTIDLIVSPPASAEGQQQRIRQLIDMDTVPEGFPEDLMPRYPGSKIVNGFVNGLGFASIEMLTTDDIVAAADYYRAHFTGLGWEEYGPIEKDIVRAYSFRGEGKIVLNVSSGGTGENHITISYDQNK